MQECINIAVKEIGYQALFDPAPGSKYGRWIAEQLRQPWLAGPSRSIWWCVCFASWAIYKAGGTLPGGPQFNTDRALAAARATGALVPLSQAKPGDLVIFDWNRATAPTDHAGILEQFRPGLVTCIEGNTSPTVAGSQSAGGGVYRRHRPTSTVAGIIRPTWPAPAPAPINKELKEMLLLRMTPSGRVYMLDSGHLSYITDPAVVEAYICAGIPIREISDPAGHALIGHSRTVGKQVS